MIMNEVWWPSYPNCVDEGDISYLVVVCSVFVGILYMFHAREIEKIGCRSVSQSVSSKCATS